jgi:acetyltransferase
MSQIYENLVDLRHAATEKSAKPEREVAAQFVSRFTMKDGAEVTLRPIRLDDDPLMAKFHQTLSDRSVYMRYFCSLSLRSRVAHERLVRICHVDGDRELALVADYKDKTTGEHRILGVGRLIKLRAESEADVAILVSDQYQKRGLGTELLRRLIQIARYQGLSRVRGELLRDNFAMQAILRKCGFRLGLRFDSPSITAVLEISSRL